MARLIPLERLRDPEEPDPYENYKTGARPEPLYDMLIVGQGTRHAFKEGVLVDERSGEPLYSTPPVPPAGAPQSPLKKRCGRPPKARVP